MTSTLLLPLLLCVLLAVASAAPANTTLLSQFSSWKSRFNKAGREWGRISSHLTLCACDAQVYASAAAEQAALAVFEQNLAVVAQLNANEPFKPFGAQAAGCRLQALGALQLSQSQRCLCCCAQPETAAARER